MPARRIPLKPGEKILGGRGVLMAYGNFGKKQPQPAKADSKDQIPTPQKEK